MWPALGLALLVAAVWHWGLPSEPAQAQEPPVLELGADTLTSDNVVVEGDTLTVGARGYDPDERIWLYLWTRDDVGTSFPACLDVAEDVNLVSEGRLDSDGAASFSIEVSVPPLAVGDNNLLCAVRRGGQYATARLTVEVPPDTYRMQLELTEISAAGTDAKNTLIADNVLAGGFEVQGARGLTEWGGSQRRGVDADDDGDIEGNELLVQVEGEWRACPKRGRLNVGCEWDDLTDSGALLATRDGSHLVPGNDMVLRLSLPDAGGGNDLNLAAERFVVFWGPVDVWLLGTQRAAGEGGVAAEDFVVHDEHLRPLASELNSKIVQLRPGDEVELEISRNSSNAQGHTFVSMVPCNDNYLKRLFGTEATAGEVAQQLRGLEDCTVQQGPAFEDYGNGLAPNASYLVRSGEHWLREAWVQHDVLSGYGLHCSITPTVYSDWVEIEGSDDGYWVDTWSLDVLCSNGAAPVSDTSTAGCYTALTKEYEWDDDSVVVSSGDVMRRRPVPPTPATGDEPGDPGSPAVSGVDRRSTTRYWCGWEPEYFKDATNGPAPRGYNLPWYNTRYNASNSFYAFAFEWELGGGAPANAYGCGAMLLPDINGTGVAIYPDASRWRVYSLPASECEAGPDDDAISIGLYAPRPRALNLSRFSTMTEPAKALAEYRARREYELVWGRYPDHSMHFAVYLSGMPSVFDYRSEESAVDGDSEGTDANAEWRLVSLGSWSYDERGEMGSGSDGGRALLGVAHPVGGVSATDDDSSALDAVPAVRELYGGRSLTITRDYANRDGYVEVYVVPCRPLHSASVPVVDEVQGACEHLPPGNGQVLGATFDGSDSIDGPFGLREPRASERDYTLDYSFKFTLRFRGSAWRDEEERRVSLPRETLDAPSGDCEVHSALTGGALYWPEVVMQGGACDSDTLETVRVRLFNDGRHDLSAGDARPDSGGRTDRLMVYATGGRSKGLERVSISRAARMYDDAESLGRLGVRERRLVLQYDGDGTIHVNPDLANRDGDVWLLFYSCGVDRLHGAAGHCPLARREFRDVPIYDVPVPPSFVVRVRFTSESGLAHTDFGPVCQGDDCALRVPILRDALPDGGTSFCDVSAYPTGVSGLVHWPDRLVQGGACAPADLSPLSVSIRNGSVVGDQKLVVYATGGRTPGLATVQVMRGGGEDAVGEPTGKVGLREVQMSLDAGDSGSVLVSPDLADEDGRVWLLAYLCDGPAEACPSAVVEGNPSLYAVDRRPLFQVLVQYDVGLLSFSGLAICRGDGCEESYPLGAVFTPPGSDCSVSASYSAGQLYWPDRLVAGGGCETNDLNRVAVSFRLPSEASGVEQLNVYVTGGRTPDLDQVSVLRTSVRSEGEANGGRLGYYADPSYFVEEVASVPSVPFVGSPSAAEAGPLLRGHDTPNVRWVEAYHRDLYNTMESKSWVQDGLTDLEKSVVDRVFNFVFFGQRGVDVANRLSKMPFLAAVDRLDLVTMRALSVAFFQKRLDSILVHSRFADGIRENERVLVIGVSVMKDLGLRDARVESGYLTLEEGTYSGVPVTVAKIGVRQDAYVIDQVGAAVVGVRELMGGGEFPVGHVVALGDPYAVTPGAAGTNYGYVMSYKLGGASGDYTEDQVKSTIVHEVAHYYWIGAERWINEGMASTFEVLLGDDFGIPDNVTMRKKGDCELTSLRSLVEAAPEGLHSPNFSCNYYLGQRLFLDLRDSLGEAEFLAGARRLYSAIRECRDSGGRACGTVDDVRAAFADSVHIVNQHWGLDVPSPPEAGSVGPIGRLGVRERLLTVEPGGSDTVVISPDLANRDGEVWLLAYACSGQYGSDSCPRVVRPPTDGYDLPVGPDFAVLVQFTEKSGLTHSTLGPVCQGNDCSPTVPVLREATPADDVGVDVCGASSYFGGGGHVYWPDRVIQGGACDRDDLGNVPVSINNVSVGGRQQLVLYATGGRSGGLELVRPRRGGASAGVVSVPFGRMGLRRVDVSVGLGELKTVSVSPDLADADGNVWLLAYLCDVRSCPVGLAGDDLVTYAVDRRPLFQLRVRFTPESGLAAADLKEVCKGQECDIVHPWLRRAEPDVGECGARLGTYWPDRVIRGGDCYVRGRNYGSVVFKADVAEKFVVYTTGDGRRELDLVQVHGVLRDGGDAAANDNGDPLGRHGLRESLIELAAGGEERTWVRSDMADDDGNVWLFAYRCQAEHGDAGCPLVDRDQVRPSYDVTVRPSFVVRVSFVSAADANRSTLEADCSSIPGRCELTATFRDADGATLPGTVEFRVDRGELGEAGSKVQVSQKRHQEDAAGNRQFKETLILPADGGMVNVEAELLGDGTVLTRRVGQARNVARLSAEVMRCSGGADSCHAGGLTGAGNLLAGDHFVLAVTGYDASGDVALPVTRLSEAECRAGRPGSWPAFRLNSEYLQSYGYGTSQPGDRGYAGCAIRVLDDAPVGTHGITVSYRAGAGAPVTLLVQVMVGVDTSKLGYLILRGPSQLKSGESGTYRVLGLNLERLPMGYALDGGCVKLKVTGALASSEGGSASDGCISAGLPKSGVEFTVQAKEDVVYPTDSSIGASYGDISVSKHVLVVPAEDRGGAVPSTSSHISNLAISQEGGQLSVTWNGDPRADFESLRAQVWVVVGGEDVFLPGCEGGDVHAVTTQQVFCMLSYGQSGDVYHAAVGFIRYDRSAVPVETAQWIRP